MFSKNSMSMGAVAKSMFFLNTTIAVRLKCVVD
jgi:hypothetical protein